jgi:glucokinase
LAFEKEDPLAKKTMELFVSIFGATAGDLCVLLIPTGGLYLLGGVT